MPDTIESIAAEELSRARGNVLAATTAMIGRVQPNEELYRQLMDPLLRTACYETICAVCRQNRQTIWNPASRTAAQDAQAVEGLARGVTMTLFDFPLPGGQKLGEASREEVMTAAQFYTRQASDMSVKGRWLTLVAEAMRRTNRRKVKSALNLTQLEQLKQAAEDMENSNASAA